MTVQWIVNSRVQPRCNDYAEISVDSAKVIKSWKTSLFSFEWLNKDGSVKNSDELKDRDRERRAHIDALYKAGDAIEKPVLGIGMLENIEIGIGKAEFLTLYDHGIQTIQVHVPKTHIEDFKPYRTDL